MLRGDITAQNVKDYLAGIPTDHLEPIMDDQMVRMKFPTNAVDAFHRSVDWGFRKLWTQPEDRLARVPLYKNIYDLQLKGSLDQYADHIAGMSQQQGNAFIRQLEGAASKRAQSDVTRVIYSDGRRTNIAQKLRFISPFLQVTTNRLHYYGTQVLENPQNMAKLFKGWNAIGTTTDQNGKPVVTVNLPCFVADHLGISDSPSLSFQKSSLNLINSGEPWYSPGFGPIASVPLAEWLRQHPQDTPDWVKTMVGSNGLGIFPNNYYGKDASDLFLPTWTRRLKSSEGQQYVNTQAQIYAQEMMNFREGRRPHPPTAAEISDRSNGLWLFRTLAAFILPAQPTLSTGQPGATAGSGQGAQAQALTAMVQMHSDYLKKYGKDGDNRFLNDHPEYYDYMISLTQNPTGIVPTNEADRRVVKYGALADTLHDPKMASLIFNLSNDYGKFEPDAYAWQQDRPVTPGSATALRTGLDDPEKGYANRVVSRGWSEYVKATQERDALLQQYGYRDIRQKEAGWVATIFNSKVAAIQKDTSWVDESGHVVSPWYDDFMTQDNAHYAHAAEDLDRIVHNADYYKANIGQQPWLATAAAYLSQRGEIAAMLDQIQAAGGSGDIRASSNGWLRLVWDAARTRFANADPQWAQIQASKFAHDDLSSIPDPYAATA